jgi:hypothetical protein
MALKNLIFKKIKFCFPPLHKYPPWFEIIPHIFYLIFTLFFTLLFYTLRHVKQLKSRHANVVWSLEHPDFASSSRSRWARRLIAASSSVQCLAKYHTLALSFNNLLLNQHILSIPLSSLSIPSTSGRWFIGCSCSSTVSVPCTSGRWFIGC